MLIIRCTQSLLKVIGPALPVEEWEPLHPLQEWYANLLWMGGKKCVLFTSSSTLFTFLVPAVTVALLRKPGVLLRGHLKKHLQFGRVPEPVIESLDELLSGDVVLAKTRDRRVLGSMNDLTRMLEFHVGEMRSWEELPIEIVRLNDAPMSFLGMDNPLRRMRMALLALAEERGRDTGGAQP